MVQNDIAKKFAIIKVDDKTIKFGLHMKDMMFVDFNKEQVGIMIERLQRAYENLQ
jgi:aromatic ring-cleaving dioxygenase